MIPKDIVARLETGDAIYFRGRGIVQQAIRFGTRLGAWLRRRKTASWHPHHVETVVFTGGELYSFGADAVAGYIRTPLRRRLAGLKLGRDYCIVRRGLQRHADRIELAALAMEGTPYPSWPVVASVWRDGADDDGAETVYCSEADIRLLGLAGVPWSASAKPANFDPLESITLSLAHCVERIGC